ncbi:10314_t:CDS:1 [Scutellospora calospora]|uniref:10314_t:CDS:1 n=1 Tax=Scutellospora calospora TaxID=85575 RepID=A0ACA9KN79_9GLOM|nr:10314_t:CDS:1 [Scutellospora calospora]
MPKILNKYYAIQVGYKKGIYKNWKDCKKQIHKYPGALYKKFNTKKQAKKYNNEQNQEKNENFEQIWTDRYYENNGKIDAYARIGVFFKDNNLRNLLEKLSGTKQTNNRAEIFAVIRAIEISKNDQDIIINTDSIYIINSYKVKNPKKNFDLVNRMNDLIKERKGKVIFKHVKGHSGIYENEQADRFAYLESQKSHVKLSFAKRKGTIKDYFKK